jgi:hypothetical protein
MVTQVHIVSFTTTYKDKGFSDTELRQNRLIKSAKQFGIQSFFSWNRHQLKKTEFYKKNKKILDYKKGAGYWLWKPYIILDALNKIKEGDFIIYCDNSMYFINDPKPLLEICQKENGILLFKHNDTNKIKFHTQKSTFLNMNINIEQVKECTMYEANIQFYQKNDFSVNFVKEWLMACLVPSSLTDNLSNDEDPSFNQHKHDMSILSILRAKYNLNGYRVPFQYGNQHKIEKYRVEGEAVYGGKGYFDIDYNSDYPTIFNWDKDGKNCKRPFLQKINPIFVLYKLLK